MKLIGLLLASLLFVSICSAKDGKLQRANGLSKDDFSAALEHCETNRPKV